MPKRPDVTAKQIEALNRKMENAIGADLFNGVRRMRTDLSEGAAQEALYDAIKARDFRKLDGKIPYAGFHAEVDKAADKIGSLSPRTRQAVRTGIRGGITGAGKDSDLLRRPLNFEAPLPGKTAALAEGRNAVHANTKRIVSQNRDVQGETRARMRRYMTDLLGPQKRDITRAVEQGIKRNLSVPEVAAQIRNKIGLTERQSLAVENSYNSALDKGFSKEYAEELSDAQSERLLSYRAETIAVTETRTLSETIKQSEWLSLEGDGKLGQEPMVTWILGALDDKTCAVCQAVANTQMPLGTPFTLDDGTECLPGFAHPRCRCYSMLTTDDDGDVPTGKDDVDARDGNDGTGDGDDADAMASRA